MLQGALLVSKQMFYSLWISILMFFGCMPSGSVCGGREIVTDTERMVYESHALYVKSVKDIQSQLHKGWAWGDFIFEKTARMLGHSEKDIKNAKITRRFFSSGKAVAIARDIGNSQSDIVYLSSVFTEFFDGSSHSFDQLVIIMHRRMMDALGYSSSTTIPQFLKIMEETNKNGRYKYVHGTQFDIYARLIALNLFVKYWYDTQIKHI